MEGGREGEGMREGGQGREEGGRDVREEVSREEKD